jgi:hypothetical protein
MKMEIELIKKTGMHQLIDLINIIVEFISIVFLNLRNYNKLKQLLKKNYLFNMRKRKIKNKMMKTMMMMMMMMQMMKKKIKKMLKMMIL